MTTITVDQKELNSALSIVKSIVRGKNTIPILNNIKMEAFSNALHLTSTNLDVEISNEIALQDTDGEFAISVLASAFSNLTQRFNHPITLQAQHTDSNEIKITSGRVISKLQTLPATDYPSIEPTQFTITGVMPASSLLRCLKATQPFMSAEESRFYLCGAWLHKRDNKLAIATSNGHTLAVASLDILPDGFADFNGAIIPSQTVGLLINALEKTDKEIVVNINDRMIAINIGDLKITSKLVDASYPDIYRLLEDDFESQFEILKSDLERLTQSTSSIQSTREGKVVLYISQIEIKAELTDNTNGSVQDFAPVKQLKGASVIFGANVKYLAMVASSICGDSPTLNLNNHNDKITIIDNLYGDIFIVMAMRL